MPANTRITTVVIETTNADPKYTGPVLMHWRLWWRHRRTLTCGILFRCIIFRQLGDRTIGRGVVLELQGNMQGDHLSIGAAALSVMNEQQIEPRHFFG